jgi:regulator of sirC expression with transglutaminase-like and TPR domain
MELNDERNLKALISLADEPDQRIFLDISDKILSYGKEAVPFLEVTWENSLDNDFRERLLYLIHTIVFQDICIELEKWIKSGAASLLHAHILISRLQYPSLDEKDIRSKIEKIKKDIWLEINANTTPLEKVRVINHVLYDIHKFRGNKNDFHAFQNSYINTLLDTGKGSPLSLGMIYIIIAQEMNIPVYGVNLPDHFVLAYTNENTEDRLEFLDEKEVLFYINPFSKGEVFSKKEVELFLKEIKTEPRESFYTPCKNTDIIVRLLNNLSYSYEKLGLEEKTNDIKILLKILNTQSLTH